MALEFAYPWFVLVAATVALATVGLWAWRRRATPALFAFGGAALLLAAAGPRVGSGSPEVKHLLVVDVSDSMAGRQAEAVAALQQLPALPEGHNLERLQLSDALRAQGAPGGGPTLYGRLADAFADQAFNGELVLVTDGQGDLHALAGGVAADRLILLPAPPAAVPDAAITGMAGPSVATQGSVVSLRAMLRADADMDVPWKLTQGAQTIADGVAQLKGGQARSLVIAVPVSTPGLVRLRLTISPSRDREPRNDQAEFPLIGTGSRIIEYACSRATPHEADALLALLRADPRNEVRVRHDLPATAAALEGVGLMVISDLPLWDSGATELQLSVIAGWVRSGGAVLMAGATGAFAPGGYRGSALEDVMPVKFRPDDDPPRHTLLLLDTSASMAEASAGGVQKLALLRDAARRVVGALDPADRVAVVGFNSRLAGEVVFAPAGKLDGHQAAIAGLRAEGRTLIRTSLTAAVEAMAAIANPRVEQRVLLVTDGEEGEPAAAEAWHLLAARMRALNLRLDVVLTGPQQPWVADLAQAPGRGSVAVTSVGQQGFDDLVATIERALAAQSQSLVLRDGIIVPGLGVAPPLVVRTSVRNEAQATVALATSMPAVYPLVAFRELIGRSGVICVPGAGEERSVALWQDAAWRKHVDDLLRFLLENAGRQNLMLLPTDAGGADLVWIGPGAGPPGDLVVDGLDDATRTGQGRWSIQSLPQKDAIVVRDGQRLLQSIALPRVPSRELAYTGNDAAFFAQAESLGYRVFSSMDAWQPVRRGAQARDQMALEWLAALAGVALILAGFARRK